MQLAQLIRPRGRKWSRSPQAYSGGSGDGWIQGKQAMYVSGLCRL